MLAQGKLFLYSCTQRFHFWFFLDHALICLFQSIAKGENLSDGWICQNLSQKLWSVHYVEDQLVLPVTNFPLVPNATTDYTYKPMGVTYEITLLQPGVLIAWFHLSPVITIQAELNITIFVSCMTPAPPCPFPYVNMICFPVSKENTYGITPFSRFLEKTPLGWNGLSQNFILS